MIFVERKNGGGCSEVLVVTNATILRDGEDDTLYAIFGSRIFAIPGLTLDILKSKMGSYSTTYADWYEIE